MLELKHITDAETLFSHWDWINKMSGVVTSPEMAVSRILSGEYKAFLGIDEGPKGIVIYKPINTIFNVIWLYAIPGELKGFPDYLWGILKEEGYTKVIAISERGESGFEKLTGLKKVHSTYEMEL